MSLYLYLLISYYLLGPPLNPIFIAAPHQDVHNAKWLLTGDSITEQLGYLDYNIINIGKSRLKSVDGVMRIHAWLKKYPEAQIVTTNFGTNDVVYTKCDKQRFYINIIYLINVIHLQNKVAVLPTIPTPHTKCLNEFNAVIKYIHLKYPSTKGLDVYNLFVQNPQYIAKDEIHPTQQGYFLLHRSWVRFVREYTIKNQFSFDN